MPHQTMNTSEIQSALDDLEEYNLDNYQSRIQSYKVMQNAVEKDGHIGVEELKRLLAVCERDTPSLKYTATVVTIIQAILSKVEGGRFVPVPDLLPSALALLKVIKAIALLGKVESLMVLCIDTLSSYPDNTVMSLSDYHEEVLETFDLCCHSKIPSNIRPQACNLLYKFLKILPQHTKRAFVENGRSIWFSKVIPSVMAHILATSSVVPTHLEVIELLTDELIHIQFEYNRSWHTILECICNTKQYPAIMKMLLHAGHGAWSRLWIVFIKLLKHQITVSLTSGGTPINSMLPVVETAFKLDVENRCKAFECWCVLIDSFSKETNENNVNKRLKLLIIPLKSNNAKTEETALAKFKCWWHLITTFQNKMETFLDPVVISFLHFCFGRHNSGSKPVLVPGQIYDTVKKQSNQALVDILGHVNCNGCTDLPKLNFKIINTKLLVENWNQWIYSLSSVIMKTAKNDNGLTKQQITCLWRSFLKTIGELPENNIRKDLFTEMLSIITHLIEEYKSNIQFLEIVFNILILSLFEEDTQVKDLCMSDNLPNDPLFKIIKIILDSSLYGFYASLPESELVLKFKEVTKLIVDESVCQPKLVMGWLLVALPKNDFALMFWTALIESMCEAEYYKSFVVINDILMWPVKSSSSFTKTKIAAETWRKSFDLLFPKVKTEFGKQIFDKLFSTPHTTIPSVYFKLCVLLAVLKHKFTDKNCMECENEIKFLLHLTKCIDSYDYFEPVLPILIDRIVAIISIVISNENEAVAALILICVKNVLHILIQACKNQTDVSHIMILIATLLKPLETLFTVKSYLKLIPAMTHHLLKCSSLLLNNSSTRNIIVSIMKSILPKINSTDTNYNEIKSLITDFEHGIVKEVNKIDQISEITNFTAPQIKEAPKRKKEASIVNTVVENGEEYVVVKSNWKFNPRKLTENQKEKLQRKREDIPALYQDLSQSQDDLRFILFKTDSQDTTSSSKSESKFNRPDNNGTSAEILKNLSSTNIVPQIMETFLSENEKCDNIVKDLPPKNVANNKREEVPSTSNKSTNSPRMALKDRVFRNMRYLMQSSGLQKENKDLGDNENKTGSYNESPICANITFSKNIINSAPTLLSADRPSRVKRKPKKFEDLELLMVKKSRHSSHDVQINNVDQSAVEVTPSTNKDNDYIVVSEAAAIDKLDEAQVSNNVLINLELSSNNQIKKGNDKIDTKNDEIQLPTNLDTVMSADEKDAGKSEDATGVLTLQISEDMSETITTKDATTPKTFKDLQVVLITKTSADGKEILTLKPSKASREVITAVAAIDNQGNSKDNEESMLAEDIKEISTPKSSKDFQELSIPEIVEQSTPISVKTGKEVSTSLANKDGMNVITPKLCEDAKESSSPSTLKNVQVVLTCMLPEDFQQTETSKTDIDRKVNECSTPKQSANGEEQKSTAKKSTAKKSRIEKELAIDMVEGHPYLKIQSQKRLTRKALESATTGRRKSLANKLNKSKSATTNNVKNERKIKEKNKDSEKSSSTSIVVDESQESEPKEPSTFADELPYSDDIIESSQDSTMTTISVKSTRKTPKKVPIVCVEKLNPLDKAVNINDSQSILDCVAASVTKSPTAHQEGKDDSVLPLNKTALKDNEHDDLTENMDTELLEDNDTTEIVVIINDCDYMPTTVNSDEPIVGPESQDIAEADTQPTDPKEFMDVDITLETPAISTAKIVNSERDEQIKVKGGKVNDTVNNTTVTLIESACADVEKTSSASSPFKDDAQRQQDFMNNTIEISPIKSMSPERNKKSPSPETSSDYVVIKLTSPVHSNGEPFEKCGSPEVFTEDKVSPDKRDQSPPRVEISVTNTSPSSSLSLKKNRPQVRAGGRAAQMLGLCVPEKVQAIVNPERNESEEVKKSGPNTPARRNLRILYNSVNDNNTENSSNSTSENDDIENFLKFRKSLPTVDCSPLGPILKRKLVEISDDAMISPASKRKRVSFHDPPVSTTISVQKYIEPGGIRSPQNSAQKRVERQLRQQIPLKSPKRLENVFKLDTALTKTVESFSDIKTVETCSDSKPVDSSSDNDVIVIPDTEAFSLDETPVVEIVKTSELNNTDPIFPDLLDCTDPISNIAGQLSSPAMKSLLVKELQGKIETIADLAKMTELDVNRLCIKAPKVKVVKKVLADYLVQYRESQLRLEGAFDEPLTESQTKVNIVEVQTDSYTFKETEMQTDKILTQVTSTNTDIVSVAHTSVQTNESGNKSTREIIQSCLSEKPDFVEALGECLEETSIEQISNKLLLNTVTDLLMKKITPSDTKEVLNRLLEHNSNSSNDKSEHLSFIRDYLCDRFESKDLLLLCSTILKIVYDKSV